MRKRADVRRRILAFLGASLAALPVITSCNDDAPDDRAVEVYAVPSKVPEGMDAVGSPPSRLLTFIDDGSDSDDDRGTVWIQVHPAAAGIELPDPQRLQLGGRQVEMTGSFDAPDEGVILFAEADVLVQISFSGVARSDLETIVSGLHLGTEEQYLSALRAP
jgi:hypothetical protein